MNGWNRDPTTPGWKTSEFWLNLAAVIVAFLIANGFGPDSESWFAKAIGIVAVILASLGYGAGRAFVKAAALRNGKRPG